MTFGKKPGGRHQGEAHRDLSGTRGTDDVQCTEESSPLFLLFFVSLSLSLS
jgi:hypothetical protein